MVGWLASFRQHLPLAFFPVVLDVLQRRGFRQGVRFGGYGLFIVLKQALLQFLFQIHYFIRHVIFFAPLRLLMMEMLLRFVMMVQQLALRTTLLEYWCSFEVLETRLIHWCSIEFGWGAATCYHHLPWATPTVVVLLKLSRWIMTLLLLLLLETELLKFILFIVVLRL